MTIDLIDIGFRGLPTGYLRVTELGNNPSIDSATVPEDIWSGGGVYPWMTGETSLEVVSSSASDAAAGTGARTVTVTGLDSGYNQIAATVTLNGTTTVAIPPTFYRINLAQIATVGSGETNAGAVTIRDAGGGTTRAVIPAGYGITRQSAYTVPAGWALQILQLLVGLNRVSASARYVTVATWIRSSARVTRLPLELTVSDMAPYRQEGVPGIFLPEKTDFALRCVFASANGMDVNGGFLGILKKN